MTNSLSRFNLIRLGSALLAASLILGLVLLAFDPRLAQAAPAPGAPLGEPQQAASPTQDDQIRLPTATPTVPGGPSPTPSRTPTLSPVIVETTGDPDTNLRSGPSLDFDIIATLELGTQLPVIGRWLGYDWYLVQWESAPEGKAWVYKPLVQIISGDITTVPAVTPPALPTIDPVVEAIEETAAVLVQTPGAAETATAVNVALVPTGIYTQTPQTAANLGGVLPTFTPPDPYQMPETIVSPGAQQRDGLPPAVLIISLGGMGLLTLIVGLLRRI